MNRSCRYQCLDASGKEIASSFGPDGNIGYPYKPKEIAHFISMLRDTRQRLTYDDLKDATADKKNRILGWWVSLVRFEKSIYRVLETDITRIR